MEVRLLLKVATLLLYLFHNVINSIIFFETDCMTGKFGIGLSACLTYVLLTSGAPMRLVTKCPNSSVGFVADFVLDSDGNPAAQAQAQTNVSTDRHVSGTTIRMQLLVSEWPMNTERGRQLMDDGNIVEYDTIVSRGMIYHLMQFCLL